MSETNSSSGTSVKPGGFRGGMGPGHGGMGAPGEKAKNFRATFRKLLGYLAGYRLIILFVMILAASSATFSILGPKIMGWGMTKLVDGLLAWGAGTGLLTDFGYIGKCVALLITLYLASAFCAYLQNYIMSNVSMKITYQFRKELSEKLNRLPLRYFDKRSHGEVLSRITNDVDTVSMTLNQSMTQMITSAATVIGILIMMLSISWLMTLVTFLVLPLSGFLIGLVMKKSQKYFIGQQRSLGEINGQIEEIYAGHNIVQVFNSEQAELDKFKKLNDELYHSAWISQFLSGMLMPIINFVSNLGYVVICILGGYLAVKRIIEVGDVYSFIQYVRSFTQPIIQIANISNTLQSTMAAAERVFEFLDEEEESSDTDNVALADKVQGKVEFQNVRFGYSEDKVIIKNFSCVIQPGQNVAIVGPTGAGKTTIVKLLMRFYEINGGRILVDDEDIHHYTRNDLRSMFGMVLQDTWLYNASVMENLRYGSFGATDDEVIQAARVAHCDEFIRALPDGYNMILNEESSNISQGQKQLLTIARTILRDPKILILDEATSSVDTRTEILIQNAMDELMQNRTSFVIAHRLSTIKNADTILVMRDGDIVEQGNHEELLSRNGFYASLYQSQFSEGEEL
ncbi:putative ABC transporter ATP-binding protein [bioreactor metagenome]|uniref:Putative ABC transporter ATP-binding protein n=1 Tax=bioreactor metagenome TaxID=1076179 RepID=A0A644WRI5_9ZZZZ